MLTPSCKIFLRLAIGAVFHENLEIRNMNSWPYQFNVLDSYTGPLIETIVVLYYGRYGTQCNYTSECVSSEHVPGPLGIHEIRPRHAGIQQTRGQGCA